MPGGRAEQLLAVQAAVPQRHAGGSLGVPQAEQVAGVGVRGGAGELRLRAVRRDEAQGVHVPLEHAAQRQRPAAHQAQQLRQPLGARRLRAEAEAAVARGQGRAQGAGLAQRQQVLRGEAAVAVQHGGALGDGGDEGGHARQERPGVGHGGGNVAAGGGVLGGAPRGRLCLPRTPSTRGERPLDPRPASRLCGKIPRQRRRRPTRVQGRSGPKGPAIPLRDRWNGPRRALAPGGWECRGRRRLPPPGVSGAAPPSGRAPLSRSPPPSCGPPAPAAAGPGWVPASAAPGRGRGRSPASCRASAPG